MKGLMMVLELVFCGARKLNQGSAGYSVHRRQEQALGKNSNLVLPSQSDRQGRVKGSWEYLLKTGQIYGQLPNPGSVGKLAKFLPKVLFYNVKGETLKSLNWEFAWIRASCRAAGSEAPLCALNSPAENSQIQPTQSNLKQGSVTFYK